MKLLLLLLVYICSGADVLDVRGAGTSSSGGINLDVQMEWYFRQFVQDYVKHEGSTYSGDFLVFTHHALEFQHS
jgi:hypothetical protein